MVRIAIYFSGRATRIRQNAQWIQDSFFKNQYDAVDLFTSLNSEPTDLKAVLEMADVYDSSIIDEGRHVVQPFDVPKQWINQFESCHETSMTRTGSMFYNNQKAFELIEQYALVHYKPYDLVVKLRSDIQPIGSTCIPLSKMIDLLHRTSVDLSDTIWIPNSEHFGGCNDQIAIGSFQAMKIYSHLFDEIEEYATKTKFHPERLLKVHLETHRMNVVCFTFHYQLDPLR